MSERTHGSYRKVRVRRPLTLGERLVRLVANPRLTKRQRLERIAILVAIVLALVYLVVSPFVARFFPGPGPDEPARPKTTSPKKSKKAADK